MSNPNTYERPKPICRDHPSATPVADLLAWQAVAEIVRAGGGNPDELLPLPKYPTE